MSFTSRIHVFAAAFASLAMLASPLKSHAQNSGPPRPEPPFAKVAPESLPAVSPPWSPVATYGGYQLTLR